MEEKNLLEFNWEDDGENFFENTPVNVEGKSDKNSDSEKVETESDKKNTKDKEVEEETFEDFETEDTQIPAETSTSIYKDVYEDLKKIGAFKHTDIEGFENMDSEKFLELQAEEYEAEVSARINSWANEELDDDAKAFIKFKREGGSTADFFNIYREVSDIPEGDIEDEKYQDEVIRYQLEQEGWDKDEIEDRLEYLTESGRKLNQAKKYEAKIKEDKEFEKQELLKRTEQLNKAKKLQEENYKKEIKEVLDKTQDIKGFSISAQEKNSILNLLTKKEYKTPNNTLITGFQKKLAEVFQDSEKTILLAKLLNNDFDFSQFEKKIIDKNTKKIKSNLEQRKDLNNLNLGSSLSGKKSLADYFN